MIEIELTKNPHPKPTSPPFGFGTYMTDHVFSCQYEEGKGWYGAKVSPYNEIKIDPSALVLHYSQSIFEGMKAYRQPDRGISLFRPEQNARRLNKSARRMAMPELPENLFLEGLQQLISVEKEWAPDQPETTLYIRPVMIATEPALGVQRSQQYLFYVVVTPVDPYFKTDDKPMRLVSSPSYVRSLPGDIGDVKASANYGKTIVALESARAKGFNNILWLDGLERKNIEEAGITNVFVSYGDHVITPPLNGNILAGITRASILDLLKKWGIPTKEEEVSIYSLVKDISKGIVKELFVSGTATVVAPVGDITFQDEQFDLAGADYSESLAVKLHRALTDIQFGRAEDTFKWMRKLN